MNSPANITDPLVLFMPSGKRGRFPVGTPVLDAARQLGVYVESVCGGRATCGRCQIEVQEGNFAKHKIVSSNDHISPKGAKEERYERVRGLPERRRLSCSAQILGDLVIDVPQDTVINAQTIRKDADTRVIARDAAIRMCYVEIEEPDMHKPLGDLDRLKIALMKDWGFKNLEFDFYLMPQVQGILRKGNWTATAAIHKDAESDIARVIALWPGLKNEAYGLACDIGSTTIAMHLVSLLSGRVAASSGTSNPQIRFGEDLMSRVSYVMMNPDGREGMTVAVREAISGLVDKVCAEGNVQRNDILDSVFVGNPIMHHLFLGIDPTELGGAPFALAVSGAVRIKASDIGLKLNQGARLYMLPCIAGHVGADAAAVTLSEGPHRQDEMMLIVDVGTNAEIVLGNRKRVVAASSPTGPAFEGAEISGGQRAAPGAIERVRIDPDTLEPKYRVIGSELWSDDPGFLDSVQATGVTGICGSGIIEIVAEMYLAGIISEDGVIDGSLAERSPRVTVNGRTFSYVLKEGEPKITITQTDVRAIQLAKAALYAGTKLLMEKQNTEHVDRIHFAGAFGSFIDPKYAMVLGLIPDCDLDKVSAVGNAAGAGARMALLNRGYRREIEDTVSHIEKIETALEPKFQEHFVYAMALPNKVDPFPKLSAAVKLPPRKTVSEDGVAGDAAPRRRSREGHAARRSRE
ncbi:drug:proton antiporter [Mesorhizobium sp. LSJC268A00]|uniref:ASKHA domain-containing protein n=1 Tax=unclassified Mesorhizobium TaxID=325217 RepID=UPI0003CF6947|nr:MULTISPECIES: ASKHA domain-containing protein [unclassified Mesorhizobium]ESW71950.1 drug:proton antiporter [Mesorhizobium sp. LSJC277A00]ESX05611.1 drug:proton antiporter [Mesorhizobium sp. LSJC268A00]ESX11488.1 drug:proton antiporter [Mesorhizobium sp. LSJC265A00]ESX62119.1 drug:proton antiporter [Mesorhizobium sp. LSHC422A00]ESX92641.1 drug:proton antiporter [Mesorhizobium sp. LNJC403B00]ESX95459.1 drug:proton antiporter [Mesorhizobium sp. LNJC405B00]ESZ16821.1 drug:proton antiporter [